MSWALAWQAWWSATSPFERRHPLGEAFAAGNVDDIFGDVAGAPGEARHRRVVRQVKRPQGLHHQRAGGNRRDHVPPAVDPGAEGPGDAPGAPAHLGDIAPLELRHPAACVVDDRGLDPVPGEHALRGAADPRIVVLHETGGVEHGLAAGGRRTLVNRGRALGGLPAEPAGMEARQGGIAVNAGQRLHERAGEPVAAARRPVGERRDGAQQPAVAVGLPQRTLDRADPAFVQAQRPLTHHQGGEIHRVHVRRRVGADRIAHVAERAGRPHTLEARALYPLHAARAVDQVEEPREALAQVFAAPAGVAHGGDAAQLAVERSRVEKGRRLPVDGGPCAGAGARRPGLSAALSRGRRVWTRQ